jgi:hypothetical protein
MSTRVRPAVVVLLLLASSAAPAFAQNLTINPHFDGGTAVPWTGTFGFDATMDDTGTPGSGSARSSINSTDGNGVAALASGPRQCFVVSPGATYTASENVFISTVNPTPDVAFLTLGWYTNGICDNSGFISNSLAQTTTTNSWVPLNLTNVVPPAGANSVLIVGEWEWFEDATHTVNFDDILLSATGGVPAAPPIVLVALAVLLVVTAVSVMRRPRHAR